MVLGSYINEVNLEKKINVKEYINHPGEQQAHCV